MMIAIFRTLPGGEVNTYRKLKPSVCSRIFLFVLPTVFFSLLILHSGHGAPKQNRSD